MKVAYCLTHPVQYQSPLIRHLHDTGTDIEVIYSNIDSVTGSYDPGFSQSVSWDIPLLDGYPYQVLPKTNNLLRLTIAIRRALIEMKADVVWIHGWGFPICRAAWLAALSLRKPVMLRSDAHLGCVPAAWLDSSPTGNGGFKRSAGKQNWFSEHRVKRFLHKLALSSYFKTVTHFLAVGSANRRFYRAYGVSEDRITLMPYAVDNKFFQDRCAEATPHRAALKLELGINHEQPVILFAGKLIRKKAPELLIAAFKELLKRIPNPSPVLIIAGEGEERKDLEELAANVSENAVKFVGFINQSQLPAYYDLCDVFVLPSSFEPWGLVVNEVMNAAKPVIISDQAGCAEDLVKEGENGALFQSGDVTELCDKLHQFITSPTFMIKAGQRSREIIENWSIETSATQFVKAASSLI